MGSVLISLELVGGFCTDLTIKGNWLVCIHMYKNSNYSTQVLAERDKLSHRPPILVKIDPDLSSKDKEDIAMVVTRQKVRPPSPPTLLFFNPRL